MIVSGFEWSMSITVMISMTPNDDFPGITICLREGCPFSVFAVSAAVAHCIVAAPAPAPDSAAAAAATPTTTTTTTYYYYH